jgi:hypothetical protein
MATVRDQFRDAWIKKLMTLDILGPDSPGTGEVMAQVDQGRSITVNIGDVGRFRVSMSSDGRMICQCGRKLDLAWFTMNPGETVETCEHINRTLATGRVFFEKDENGAQYPVFAFSRGNGRVVAKPADGARNVAVDALASVISQLAMYGTNSKTATENAQKIITKLKAKGYMIVLSEGNEADLIKEQAQRLAATERQKRIAEKAAEEAAAIRERQRIAEESAKKTRWIQLDE